MKRVAGRRRARISFDFLAASKLILDDYIGFLATDPTTQEESANKIFAGRHTAAKAALSHLEQLLKLAAEEADAKQLEEIGNSLARYRSAMTAEIKEEPEPDDHGDGG